MTSPGERQHYALALLQELLFHLPKTMTVGFLYDIGCQFHHSCVKWDFLGEDLSRIHFGISVFHAFAHNWACQLVYHPRKCEGFGLSDGEGCERLWSELKRLIPSLRVSGVSHFTVFCVGFSIKLFIKYHQRLSVLDAQVHFLHSKSTLKLGEWLKRKWIKCQQRKKDAQVILVDHDLQALKDAWAAQVNAQSRPLPSKIFTCSDGHLLTYFARTIQNQGYSSCRKSTGFDGQCCWDQETD